MHVPTARIFLTVPVPAPLAEAPDPGWSGLGRFAPASLQRLFCTNTLPMLTARVREGRPLVSAGRWCSSHMELDHHFTSALRALGLLQALLLHAGLLCVPLDAGPPRHASCTLLVPFPAVELPWAAGGIGLQPLG